MTARRWLRAFLAALALLLVAGGPSRASKVEALSKLLLEDSSYKVRMHAALVLGRLGDRDAVEPLSKALSDSRKEVRAMAAQSLGKIGAPEAAAALKALIKRERDKFVAREAERALAAIVPEGKGKVAVARVYLAFGSFSGGKAADPALLDVVRKGLRRELEKMPSVTFSLSADEEKGFAKSGRLGFLVDGNITRLDDSAVGGAVETNCDVKVMVARWPSKSIIMWTNAGAAVQGGSRDRDRNRRECLEASAAQLGEDLAKFFQSQGG